jgi:hypothetical protein
MVSTRTRQCRDDPATRGSRAGSLAVAGLVAAALMAGWTSAADARGGWHRSGQAAPGGEADAAGGRRHGNDSYMKAASAERDKLLNNKLKSICRGC